MAMTLLMLSTAAAATLSPWQVSWNEAAAALNAGDAAGCLAGLPEDPVISESPEAWLDLGYTCAVVASDLGRADAYRTLLGPWYAPRGALDIHHAWLKRQAGEPEAALALLAPLGWLEPHQQSVGRTLQLMLLADTGQWDEAYVLAFDPAVDPKAQATLAKGLVEAGRLHEARWVLDNACPRLDAPEIWGCGAVVRVPGVAVAEGTADP